MKIFAKRTRSTSTKASKVADDASKTFESDAVVEALLKQDPSTWNAKHRRFTAIGTPLQ